MRYDLDKKILRTDRPTVNDISPACLLACGDNKQQSALQCSVKLTVLIGSRAGV